MYRLRYLSKQLVNDHKPIIGSLNRYDTKPELNISHISLNLFLEEQTILEMVKMGLGISILPELILVNVPKNVHIVDLDKPHYRIIGIAALSLKDISPAEKKFIECARSWLRDHDLLEF